MLKAAAKNNLRTKLDKNASSKPAFVGALASGLNRRAFLQQSSIALLAGNLFACKPTSPTSESASNSPQKIASHAQHFSFNKQQKLTLDQVQMQLFPADGDGPSAQDINALDYLQWALTDRDNAADGDDEYIVKGIGWLDGLSEQTQGAVFIKLEQQKQHQILERISQSSAGENWLSLLIYYLIEALVFDPFYGGNTNQIGWQWLQHQPGFPRPDVRTHYRHLT
ncbi:MAG: gluconate 2-dehydrogenase subunit 3 family protein [Enterobacterales bacterium]|nr:gluconate 2-dehydrogenase subunit 3 family protein [Enterobacterales bacterium]